MKIGVFDSGIGGKSVANAIAKTLPELEIVYVNDKQHLPYGDKTPEQLLKFTVPILKDLEGQGCQVIVVACNTVTTTIIARLRQLISVPLIGIEPMIRPASKLTTTGTIAVCATPSTLRSKRYAWLKHEFATGVNVLEPDCSSWAGMIEDNNINSEKIKAQIDELCTAGADVIVLGCTHYHWIEQSIKQFAKGRAEIIQPEQAIVKRLRLVLEQLS